MKNILDALYQNMRAFPEREAVEDERHAYTWRELTLLSEKLGTVIAAYGKTQVPVPVFMEKDADMLAAFLGVVQADCFYVPVDPALPEYRIRKMFQTLRPEFVICRREKEAQLKQTGYTGEIVLYEEGVKGQVNHLLLKTIQTGYKPSDILYTVFTSGSTGAPKAVVVSHQGVMDFMEDFLQIFSFSEADIIASQAPFDFDVSVKDIYSAIYTGAKLVLVPRRLFSVPAELLEFLCEKKVTALIWAVSALCLITSFEGMSDRIPETLNKVLFSGEVMPVSILKLWQKAFPRAEFVNLYGPSEVVCNCTYYIVDNSREYGSMLPLGTAFPKREVFLLNDQGEKIEAAGEKGEICVSGNTLADGYYHNAIETRRRFIRRTPDGKTFYKTGDIGFFDGDGLLYFAGRKDFQVKRLGHRIELEEIEAETERNLHIRRSCCMYFKERQKLVLFYEGAVDEKTVKREIKKILPRYMVPDKCIKMDSFELNKNGKLDRKKLEQYGKEILYGHDGC